MLAPTPLIKHRQTLGAHAPLCHSRGAKISDVTHGNANKIVAM